jgi:hypothetical protein
VSVLDLRAVLSALVAHEVRFVIIGGVAVGAHGYVRGTDDLDIVPEPSAENADRLARALGALNSALPTAGGRAFEPAGDIAALKRRRNLTLDTRHGGLDIVQQAVGVPAYATLEQNAVAADLLGVGVRVCSLPHLRAMKEARGNAQDKADLERLPEAPAPRHPATGEMNAP